MLLAFLQEELSNLEHALVDADRDKFQALQGAARGTRDILKFLREIPAAADKQQKR